MTPKQAERIQEKITKMKKELAADKRRWGGFYDDSRGLRYLPPALYIKLGDYSGAKRYFNWFAKNFPDDMGYPVFLFEWTLTLFKTQKMAEAEQKAQETYRANTSYSMPSSKDLHMDGAFVNGPIGHPKN